MARVILIPADPQYPIIETTKDLTELESFYGKGTLVERVSSGPLRDTFGSVDNLPVLVVDEEGRVKGMPYNERATILYVPAVARNSHWIAGDAYVVGEGMTPEGPDFIDLPETVGARDVQDIIDRFRKI